VFENRDRVIVPLGNLLVRRRNGRMQECQLCRQPQATSILGLEDSGCRNIILGNKFIN
jgi:hypothetical protein